MALTADEKDRTRNHLGFPTIAQANTFFLGIPAAMEPFFVLEGAMNTVLPSAETRFRDVLGKCDSLRQQIFDDSSALIASEVGSIKLRDDEYEKIMQRYDFFVGELANTLGVFRNPFDKRFTDGRSGHINVGVSH